ncbi:MAG: ArsR family transcriptional regulator [Anaerolineales bacterium]|nr:MAG: ArsR family transcriptional regulator [Anaerolineales bacterium]
MTNLDPVIHQPVRLRICASLASLSLGDSMEFTFLRDLLDLTDGNLGAHLRKLEEAGYLMVEKTFVERKPKSFIAITSKGRRAFKEHVKALRKILKSAG